ncbi:hypothetical protein PG995_012676 [Apiospora arundinis]|uniref:Uncharacterized protein n=1 Tax=Apiospora arundinis TaxID=335852 RepID=A0ABR2I499_9PEZI
METNKATTRETTVQQAQPSGNPFNEHFEVTIKTIEIEEREYERKYKEWRDSHDANMNISMKSAEASLAISRARLQEEVDNAAKVIEHAKGRTGLREESAELLSLVRRVRRQHLKESSP